MSSRAYASARVATDEEGAVGAAVEGRPVGEVVGEVVGAGGRYGAGGGGERGRRRGEGRDGRRAAAARRPQDRHADGDDRHGRSGDDDAGALVAAAPRDGDGREVPGHLDARCALPEQGLQLLLVLAVGRGHGVTSFMLRRKELSARLVWLLTVPTETPRISAVWASVRSS